MAGMIFWRMENGGERSLEKIVWEDVWLRGKIKKKKMVELRCFSLIVHFREILESPKG